MSQFTPTLHAQIQANRFVLKIGGESGQGVNSIGEIFAKTFKATGWYVFGYREYPSLIKGGYSCYQLDVSEQPLNASSAECDVLVCLSRVSVHKYLPTVRPGGKIIHSLPKLELTTDEQNFLITHHIECDFIPAEKMAVEHGGKHIMLNTVMTGCVCKVLGLDLELIKTTLSAEFADKPQLKTSNLNCLQAGYDFEVKIEPVSLSFAKQPNLNQHALLTGNHAVGLGAVAAGVRAYYAYPMTPASSILTYLASIYHQTGMLVKQIEDEISVAQMALGSMLMGTRAMVATSGGGFDLMTESLSLSGITEIPWVCVLGQRPGPATGLPTWTAAGDLNLAVYAGHGEYARCVLAASDPVSCYELVQVAFNLAEKFQVPVIVLTDKEIAESLFCVESFPEPLPITRHLVPESELANVKSSDRYADSASGVSARWLPGQTAATFDANGDEHVGDGSLTEEAAPVTVIYDKRMRKLQSLQSELPEPKLYGPAQADVTLVGWSSVKNAVLDAMAILAKTPGAPTVNYLHYEYLYPLPTATFMDLTRSASRLVLIENNYVGQLGALLTQHTGYQFKERLLKYNGRPFFVEDVLAFIQV